MSKPIGYLPPPPLNICQLQGLRLQLGLGWLGRRQTAKDHSSPAISESLVY